MLHDYIKNRKEFKGCKVIEKCDDGFSGTHFDNRPQFTEMIELAKKGKIDGIVVKDFSRFGRDYVELGNYLEQLFPFMGVRFISANDNYDSAELAEGTTGGLDVAFKNLIYDYYSREMSRKQRIAWQRILSDEGNLFRTNRSIQAEGSFGNLKQDMQFRRYVSNRTSNVFAESILLAMARNINKLHNKIQKGRIGTHLFPVKSD